MKNLLKRFGLMKHNLYFYPLFKSGAKRDIYLVLPF